MKIENGNTGEYVEFEWGYDREPNENEAQQIWQTAQSQGAVKKKGSFDFKKFLKQSIEPIKELTNKARTPLKTATDLAIEEGPARQFGKGGLQAIESMANPVDTVLGLPITAIPKAYNPINKITESINAKLGTALPQAPKDIYQKTLETQEGAASYPTTRYGTLEQAKETLNTDPFGVSMDLLMALGLGGAGIKAIKSGAKAIPTVKTPDFKISQIELLKDSGLSSNAVKDLINNKGTELRQIAQDYAKNKPVEAVAENIPKAEAIAKIKELVRPMPEIPEGYKMSKTAESFLKSDRPTSFKEDVLASPESVYKERPFEVVKQEVNELLKNPKQAEEIVLKNDTSIAPDTLNTLNIDLIDKNIAKGNRAMASKLSASLIERGTKQGQAISSMKNINPTKGVALYNAIDSKLLELQKRNPIKYAKISEGIKEKFRTMADDIVKMTEETPEKAYQKNLKAYKLYKEMNSLIPDSAFQQGLSLYKAGLLTMLKSHARNITSNITKIVLDNVAKVPATAYDVAISKTFGTPRTTTLPNIGEISRGSIEGFKEAVRTLKTGYDERMPVDKIAETVYSDNVVMQSLGKVAKGIFRALKVEDKITYKMEHLTALYEQAKVKAINLGLKNKEMLNAKTKEFLKTPSSEMKAIAEQQAKEAVFQQKTVLGDMAKTLSQKTGKISELSIPFSQTPSAYITELVNYSPAGAAAEGLRQFINMSSNKQPFNQRLFVKTMGKSTVGSIIGLGAYLYGQNAINTLYPKGKPKEISLDRLQNKLYKSITINGKQIPLANSGVIGDLMLLGAIGKEGEIEKGSKAEGLIKGLSAIPKVILDAPLLTNLSNIQNAMQDTEGNLPKFVSNLATSFIPTAVGAVTRSADPYKRFTKAKGFQNQLTTTILSKVNPQVLPPAVSVLGEKVTRDTNLLKEVADFMNTTKLKNQDNPVVQEFVRLAKKDLNPTPVPLDIKEKISGKDVDIDPYNVSVLQEYIGTRFNNATKQLINSNIYKKLPDENKSNEIEKIYSDIKKVSLIKYGEQTGILGRGDIQVELNNMDDSQKVFYFYDKYMLKPNISAVIKKKIEDYIRSFK